MSDKPRYTTSTGGSHFTVITEKSVYRVRATNEERLRRAFDESGIEILALERDRPKLEVTL